MNGQTDGMLELTGGQLSIEDVVAVAFGAPGSPRVALSADAQAKVKRAADGVQTLVSRGQIAYGITTGFGAFKDHVISPDQAEQLQGTADTKVAALLEGNGIDVHNAMIAVEKADLSFQLMMQVRNKIVAAYQEISRMQF